jgi:hypothetical protein
MSSVGQALGGIVGGVVGFFVGGPTGALYGAQIGMGVGGLIDPPKGPNINGPRLSDLSVQTSTYGVPIPRVYGTIATHGNVIWIEGDKLKEVATKTKQGGKGGGGGATTTTYSYFATFAVGLCKGPIAGIRRIWVGANLIYDAGADDLESIIASNEAAEGFAVYLGTDDQQAEPRMQADKGAASTPAYRGLAYIVFYDLALKDYGNSLQAAQVKVEVAKTAAYSRVLCYSEDRSAPQPHANEAFPPRPYYVSAESVTVYAPQWSNNYPAVSSATKHYQYGDGAWFVTNIEVIGGTGYPPNGTTDNPDEFWKDRSEVFNAGGSFSGPDGYIIKRGGIAVGLSRLTGRIYITQGGPESTISAPSAAHAVCAISGHVYAIETGLVRQYDLDLNLIGEISAPVWIGGLREQSRAFPANDAVYLVTNPGDLALYRIELDLSKISLVTTIVDDSGSYYNTEYALNGSLLTVAYGRASPGRFSVRRYNLEQFAIGEEAGATLQGVISSECDMAGAISALDIETSLIDRDLRGYRVAQIGAIRGALEPLQAAWPFDTLQSGYKIAFRPRGASSVATIPSAELDARPAGDTPGVQLTIAREMDTQIPRRVVVRYLDTSREYDISEQAGERLSTESIHLREVDLPIVLTATEAAGMAEVLLYLYWLERREVSFRLPPLYRYLEPADVITVTGEWGQYELRLTTVHLMSDGRLECQARYNAAAIYTPTAQGEEGASVGKPIALAGPSDYALLDIPLLRDQDNAPGFPAAMAGYTTGWPGGVLFRSPDGGQTWAALQGFDGPATLGFARAALAAGRTDIIDATSVLQVDMLAGELESVTELAMLSGANYFALGADGRWEIIGARTCELQADGSYILRDFLRGRFGTEWAMAMHQAGDVLVLLTDPDLAWIGMDADAIGLARNYRGITSGRTIDTDGDRAFTYRAVNLEPLSPVYLNGSRHPSSGDWSLSWIRRGRVSPTWRNNVDVPLGEASEAYEVEIYTDPSYTTVKRTIAVTAASASYTGAQQVADFGANQGALYLRVYQLSATVGRGYPLQTSITR